MHARIGVTHIYSSYFALYMFFLICNHVHRFSFVTIACYDKYVDLYCTFAELLDKSHIYLLNALCIFYVVIPCSMFFRIS